MILLYWKVFLTDAEEKRRARVFENRPPDFRIINHFICFADSYWSLMFSIIKQIHCSHILSHITLLRLSSGCDQKWAIAMAPVHMYGAWSHLCGPYIHVHMQHSIDHGVIQSVASLRQHASTHMEYVLQSAVMHLVLMPGCVFSLWFQMSIMACTGSVFHAYSKVTLDMKIAFLLLSFELINPCPHKLKMQLLHDIVCM